jgi:hypothetical protein
MAMPVSAGDVPLGMLFLDAPRAGALTGQDVPIVKLFADHLASALILGAQSGYKGNKP